MSKKRIVLYSLSTLLVLAFSYFYIWEKPKLELLVQRYIESLSKDDDIPVKIDIGRTNFSIIPLQLELYETDLIFKKDLGNTLKPMTVGQVTVRPGLLDLIIGKFWISLLRIENTSIKVAIDTTKKTKEGTAKKSKAVDFDLNKILKQIPLSKIELNSIAVDLNIKDQAKVSAENIYLNVFNKKSSLYITLKEPNLGIQLPQQDKPFNVLAEVQGMVTKNTISLSQLKLVKDSSFFIASGNMIYQKSPENFSDLQMDTRLKSSFDSIKKWGKEFGLKDELDILKGDIRTDIKVSSQNAGKKINIRAEGGLQKFQVEKVKIGDLDFDLEMPNLKQVNIKSVKANLVGNNPVEIHDSKVHIDKKTEITAKVRLDGAELHSFLKQSTIADIPVWLKINGELECAGAFEKNLLLECPGALTVRDLKIQNKGRSKNIVKAKRIDIAGTATITEKAISYSAKANMKTSKATSTGVIDFDKGFDIKYQSDLVDLNEIGPIADLKFSGVGKLSGSTQGTSRTAVFGIDIDANDFEFENYFFGGIKTELRYKLGSLYFNKINGSLESTRYTGQLTVDLLKENISGDLQLPFFRMADIQQAILKKVDLKNRFQGSGSGRLRLNTPFDIDKLNFQMDALLFKGKAFGEDYNEAKLKAEAVDGIIILQEAVLRKERNQVSLRGTIDMKLDSKIKIFVDRVYLEQSTILKNYGLPLTGEVVGTGEIIGPLAAPQIKTKVQVSNLAFNKTKYGDGVFSYDNTKGKQNIQFKSFDQIDLVMVFPEDSYKNVFVNIDTKDLDIAPILSFAVSDDATRSYLMKISGEISGRLNFEDMWESEFSSTVRDISINYKANKLRTKVPSNIEMKNGKLILNEFSLTGQKQYLSVIQAFTETYKTKFIISSRMNIAFFKLFAPFIEKIDGYTTLRLELDVNKRFMKLIGSSYTSDGFVKFPGFPHALEDVSADVLFNQNKVLINSISGQLAGGTVLGNGEIKFPGRRAIDLYISTDFSDVDIDFPEGYTTKGHGNIVISGQKTPFLLSGNYNVENGLIESNFSTDSDSASSDLLEELLKKETASPLNLDVKIKTLRPVEVRNSLIEGYMWGDLRVFDKITAPRIQGEAHFDTNSLLLFRDQEFQVTSSSFIFEGRNPINPKLSLRAQTRLNQFDIEMFLQGRAAKPVINWASQPPLPETQIISMLVLGPVPNQIDQNNPLLQNNDPNANNQQGNNFEVSTNFLSQNPLGKELKERSGFDVQFSTSFDDQTSTMVPRVTLRRKLGKKLQMSISSTTGATNQQEGRVTYELNNEVSTIFRVQNIPDDVLNNNNNGFNTQQNNPFGVDLQYQMEYD